MLKKAINKLADEMGCDPESPAVEQVVIDAVIKETEKIRRTHQLAIFNAQTAASKIILREIQINGPIHAMKTVKDVTGWNLREAKDVVDALRYQ